MKMKILNAFIQSNSLSTILFHPAEHMLLYKTDIKP